MRIFGTSSFVACLYGILAAFALLAAPVAGAATGPLVGTWQSSSYEQSTGKTWVTTITLNSDNTYSNLDASTDGKGSYFTAGTYSYTPTTITITITSATCTGDAGCNPPVGTIATFPYTISGSGVGSTMTTDGSVMTKISEPSLSLYTLSVARAGAGSGTIASDTGGIDCGTDCWADYADGTHVTLTATPASGSYFSGWSGACSGAGSCVVTMDDDRSVTATFKPVPFVANTTSTITATSATITTAITFNTTDVGKPGAVYVTSWAPANGLGALGIMSATTSHAMSVTVTNDNPFLGGNIDTRQETLGSALAAGTSTFVLVQLTSTGWQLVQNGQLIPYASGVLGDQLASLSILNNANPANLLGAQFCVGYGTSAAEMVAAGRMMLVAAIGSGPAATVGGSCNIAAGIPAMEFYNSQINHYFMTASTDEATALDNKPEWNWVRTGKTFNIWMSQSVAPVNASPVCRFFGVFSNGTVGSHFYTVDAAECDMLKSRLDWGWGYENNAFYAVKPVGGICPGGTSPVYRAYNNGMGGAPNHRYVATQAEVDAMVAQGWVSEGTAFCGAQ